MEKLLYVPNPLLRQKSNTVDFVGEKELSIAKGTLQNAIHRPATARFANRKFVVVCICWNFFITNSTTKFPRKAPDISML